MFLRNIHRIAAGIFLSGFAWLLLKGDPLQAASLVGVLPQGPDDDPIYYVALNGDCGGAMPCYPSVQAAVDAVDAPGDIVKVAAGMYTGVHVRAGVVQVVYVDKTLTLQGGYTLTNWTTPDPVQHPTILNAQDRGRVLYITGAISPLIEGFQIVSGNARGLGGIIIDEWGMQRDAGGGIYLNAARVALKSTVIISNAAEWGGGIFVSGAQVDLRGNTWAFNTAELGGGGYWFSAPAGQLTGDAFRANLATAGGGLYLYASDLALTNIVFSFNLAWDDGGGIYFANSQSMLQGNTYMGNTAARGGGLFLVDHSDIRGVNTLVANNHAELSGAGVYVETSAADFTHTTLARNHGGDGSGLYAVGLVDWWGAITSTVRLTNTIVAGQPVGVWAGEYSAVTLEATLWGNGQWANGADWQGLGLVTGTHHLWGDPAFTCADRSCLHPYRIGAASAALDAGVLTAVAVDIDGEPRPSVAPADLGIDEHSILSTAPARVKDRFVFAFYHPWYDLNTWDDPEFLDQPLFLHNSADPHTIRRHLMWSGLTGIDGLLVSWAGPTHPTNAIFAQTLDAMRGTDLRATAYFEISWAEHFDSVATVLNDMRYFMTTYGSHPQLLRQDGRPVLFLYAVDTLPRGSYPRTYEAWQFIVETLHFAGYYPFLLGETFILDPAYLTIFDGLFTYFPTASVGAYQSLSRQAHQSQRLWMPGFYPGFDDHLFRDPYIYIPRNQGKTYATSFAFALNTIPDWLAVTSFNEWYENTHIEPSRRYGYDYLLYTADFAAQFNRWHAYSTVYVDPAYVGLAEGTPGRPFRTLEEALFSAADGATVYLMGGDYVGPFTVTHSITLTGGYGPGWTPGGAGLPTVLRGAGAGPVVRVEGGISLSMPDVTLADLTLTGGHAAAGGGIHSQSANVTLRRVTVSDNRAQTLGGGVFIQGGALHLDAARVLNNTATLGGGFYAGPGARVYLTNTLIAGNAATLTGGAGYLHPSSVLHILHGTLTANAAPDVGGLYAWLWPSQTVWVRNSILWGNAARDLQCNAACVVRYSDVGGGWLGLGNLDVAPGFADDTYHLAAHSPLIDMGETATLLPLTDFEGERRVLGLDVDMGADEFNPVLRSSLTVTPPIALPGSVLTHTVRLVSAGGVRTRFVVTDTLSPWTRYVPGSAQASLGTVRLPITGTGFLPEQLVWTGTLNPNQVLTLRFSAIILSATLESCETITNVAVFQTDQVTFTRYAVTARGPLERGVLQIETAPEGHQPLLVSQPVTRGVPLSLYAAGYNGCGQYLGPVPVTWTTSGTLPPQASVGTRFHFTPTWVGSTGMIVAEDAGLYAQTGRLSVVAPPELMLPPLPLSGTQPAQTVRAYPLALANGDALSLTYVLAPVFVEPFVITYTWDASFFVHAVIVGRSAPLAHPEWSYYFAPELVAPRLIGAQVSVTELDMQVYGVNLSNWVNWDWEAFLSDGDITFPEGQFLSTRTNPYDTYARTTPVWVAVSIGERQTTASYRYHASHNFETGATVVTPFRTGDVNSHSLPLTIQDGLHAQVFLWTGDSRVAQQFDGLQLTVRGVATYTTPSTAWLTAQPQAGLIPPRSFETVQLKASSYHLPLGIHSGTLWLRTNDVAYSITPIPFYLTVSRNLLHLPLIMRAH
ncbi:MAG TPA: right-handed parallel beta-helix repeat-containing protein [Anaerolineae bacterium]|nr:right-handed parallel beta-helix repeat-containing protein [Anaerolineae bacterium]